MCIIKELLNRDQYFINLEKMLNTWFYNPIVVDEEAIWRERILIDGKMNLVEECTISMISTLL